MWFARGGNSEADVIDLVARGEREVSEYSGLRIKKGMEGTPKKKTPGGVVCAVKRGEMVKWLLPFQHKRWG